MLMLHIYDNLFAYLNAAFQPYVMSHDQWMPTAHTAEGVVLDLR